MIFSHVLYQLSYPGIAAAAAISGRRAMGAPPMASRGAPVQPLSGALIVRRIVRRIGRAAGQGVTVCEPADEIAIAAAS